MSDPSLFSSIAFTRCTYCEIRLEAKHEYDHFVPESKGGLDKDNLFAVCRPCNIEKGGMLFESINQVRVFIRLRKLFPYIDRKVFYLRLTGNEQGLECGMKVNTVRTFWYTGIVEHNPKKAIEIVDGKRFEAVRQAIKQAN